MNIEIKRLNHTGEGIGEIDHKIIFIPKTLPGDIVTIRQKQDHGNYYTGIIKDYQKQSPDRVPIPCPYYSICGGCQLMGLSYSDQIKYKQEKVKDILKKYAGLEITPQIIPSPLQENYRNKITLHVKDKKLGLYQTNTNDLIPIEKCLLVKEKINKLIPILQNEIDLSHIEQIIIKEHQNELMVMFIGNPVPKPIQNILKNKVKSIYIHNKLIFGQPKLEEKLGEYIYQISPTAFFQVNHDQTINLYNKVKEYLGFDHSHILDLYCGSASIGIYVSDCAKKITGIERNPSSIKDANENILKNNLTNIEVIEGDVGQILKANHFYDAIILDPPRSGLDKKTKSTLLQIKSPKIIYVSCDPITLARDLKELSSLYEIKEVTALDMFPGTYHVECVIELCRKK